MVVSQAGRLKSVRKPEVLLLATDRMDLDANPGATWSIL
jgi:hypothetical protein